jgi:hypothetical protein
VLFFRIPEYEAKRKGGKRDTARQIYDQEKGSVSFRVYKGRVRVLDPKDVKAHSIQPKVFAQSIYPGIVLARDELTPPNAIL